jgi:hypothetical protein
MGSFSLIRSLLAYGVSEIKFGLSMLKGIIVRRDDENAD